MIITMMIILPNKGSGVEGTESVSSTSVSNLAFTTIFSPGLTNISLHDTWHMTHDTTTTPLCKTYILGKLEIENNK